MKRNSFKQGFLVAVVLLIFAVVLMATVNHPWWVSIQKKGTNTFNTKIFMKHNTTDVLDFSNSATSTTIGNVWLTGVPVRELYKLPNGVTGDSLLAAEWVMNRDTSNNIVMFRYHDGDLVFRRAKIYGVFSGDTLLVDFYKRGTSGTASAIVMTEGSDVDADTLIATTDTTFTLTPTSTTTLDYSAGEGIAIRVTPLDTLLDVQIAVEFDTYDVQ